MDFKPRVVCMDNMEFMAQYPDKFFDLAIVDPEYRDNNQPDKSMRKKGLMSGWFGAPKGAYFKELMRVSKNQIIFGGNYFTQHLEANNNWFIWYKNNDGLHMSMCEMAWVSIRKNTKVFDFRPMGHNVDWHPTAKPVTLYNYLLKTYASTGDKILDTHLGSGSSRIAAYDQGFDFYGTELDETYFNNQEKRFAKHIAQTKLFSPSASNILAEQTQLL